MSVDLPRLRRSLAALAALSEDDARAAAADLRRELARVRPPSTPALRLGPRLLLALALALPGTAAAEPSIPVDAGETVTASVPSVLVPAETLDRATLRHQACLDELGGCQELAAEHQELAAQLEACADDRRRLDRRLQRARAHRTLLGVVLVGVGAGLVAAAAL